MGRDVVRRGPEKPLIAAGFSNDLENRQRQHGLRQKAYGEGERAEHRQAQCVNDHVRETASVGGLFISNVGC